MKNQLIQLIQKDIEIFRYCIELEAEIFSNHQFELSSIEYVSGVVGASQNEAILELAIELGANTSLSSSRASQELFSLLCDY